MQNVALMRQVVSSIIIHCVSKNIPNIFDCNLKTNYQIFYKFGYEYSKYNLPSNDHSFSHLTQCLFLGIF